MHVFIPEQVTFLTTHGKLTGEQVDAIDTLFAKNSAILDQAAWQNLKSWGFPDQFADGLRQAVAAYRASRPAAPTAVKPVAPVFPGGLAVPTTQNVIARLEVHLSSANKAGKIAKLYKDNPSLWPALDCFERPMPSLEQILGMPKQEAQGYVTQSGFPKVTMDGMRYYIQEQEGCDMHTLYEMEKAHYESVRALPVEQRPTFDRTKAPVTIKAGDWRWWDGQIGPDAMYARPDQHLMTCEVRRKFPTQYLTLLDSRKPVAPVAAVPVPGAVPAAPAAPAAPRRSRKKVQGQ